MTTHISSPSTLLPFQRLDVYLAARELARLVHLAGIRDAELRDQATQASKSAFLCLAEGLPNDGPAMRRKYPPRPDLDLDPDPDLDRDRGPPSTRS